MPLMINLKLKTNNLENFIYKVRISMHLPFLFSFRLSRSVKEKEVFWFNCYKVKTVVEVNIRKMISEDIDQCVKMTITSFPWTTFGLKY